VAEAAGPVDRAEHAHQDRQRADGLEAVGVRRQPAHRVKGHRVAGDRLVLVAPGVRPGDGQFDLLVPRGDAHFMGQAVDRIGGDTGDAGSPLRRVFLQALGEQLERRADGRAVLQRETAEQVGIGCGRMGQDRFVALAVPPQLVLRVETTLFYRDVAAHEQAVIGRTLVPVHQFGRIRVLHQELAVVQAAADDDVGQRQEQRAVGTGPDRHPFVGDGRVPRANGIDRDEPAALTLEFRNLFLERVRVVVLGRADHHEQPGALEVGPAELPERTADGIDHAGGHVDRAEAAVRGVVRRAELPGEQARQRLHLVAAGEQREFFRVGGAQMGQPLLQEVERALPGNLLELVVAALAALLAQQRFGQAGRGVLLHQPARALGADHPLVDRVVRVALDEPHFAVAQGDTDAATAGAHVTGGVFDLDAALPVKLFRQGVM
jgi:hypothetical protein